MRSRDIIAGNLVILSTLLHNCTHVRGEIKFVILFELKPALDQINPELCCILSKLTFNIFKEDRE